MKKFLFAVAVVCLFAASSPAADPPVTTTAPAPTVVTSGTTVYATTTPTTPARRMGLFSRFRNRSSNAAYSTMPATVMTPATPMPGTIVPTPMPKTTTSGVVTSGGITTVDGKVVETMVMPMTSTTTTRTGRMGLFSRLRYRSSGYTTMPATVVMPATPMPTTKPMTGASTGTTGVVTAGGTTVVEGMPVETIVMPMTTTTTRTGRIGLIQRMRMRMGY